MLRKADLKETLSEKELAAVPKTVTYNEMGPPDARIASQTFLKHAQRMETVRKSDQFQGKPSATLNSFYSQGKLSASNKMGVRLLETQKEKI